MFWTVWAVRRHSHRSLWVFCSCVIEGLYGLDLRQTRLVREPARGILWIDHRRRPHLRLVGSVSCVCDGRRHRTDSDVSLLCLIRDSGEEGHPDLPAFRGYCLLNAWMAQSLEDPCLVCALVHRHLEEGKGRCEDVFGGNLPDRDMSGLDRVEVERRNHRERT